MSQKTEPNQTKNGLEMLYTNLLLFLNVDIHISEYCLFVIEQFLLQLDFTFFNRLWAWLKLIEHNINLDITVCGQLSYTGMCYSKNYTGQVKQKWSPCWF